MDIIFVRRQSPSWAALSRAYRAGQRVDTSCYMPGSDILGFPHGALVMSQVADEPGASTV